MGRSRTGRCWFTKNKAEYQVPHLINVLLNAYWQAGKSLRRHDLWITFQSSGGPTPELQGRGELKVHDLARSLGRVQANATGREPPMHDADAMQFMQREGNLEREAESTERVCRF